MRVYMGENGAARGGSDFAGVQIGEGVGWMDGVGEAVEAVEAVESS